MAKSQSIAETLQNEILNTKYIAGTVLPSENSLAKRFKAHRNTVRQAISILSEKGFIQKKNGIGSIVLHHLQNKNSISPSNHGSSPETYCIIVESHKNIYIANMIENAQRNMFSQNIFSFVIYQEAIENNCRFVSDVLQLHNIAGVFIIAENNEKVKLLAHLLKENGIAFTTSIRIPGFEENFCPLKGDGSSWIIDKQVEYLSSLGHKKIGFIAGAHHRLVIYKKRLESFIIALRKYAEIYDTESNSVVVDFSMLEWPQQVLSLYYEKKITAFVCFDDSDALQAINMFHLRNICIPGDLSIIGYGDFYKDSDISITTIPADFNFHSERNLAFMKTKAYGNFFDESLYIESKIIKEGTTCKKIN